MLKQILRLRSALIFVFCVSFFCSSAFAQGYGNGDTRANGRQDARTQVSRDSQRHGQGGKHYYRNGRWYRRGWLAGQLLNLFCTMAYLLILYRQPIQLLWFKAIHTTTGTIRIFNNYQREDIPWFRCLLPIL